MQDYVREEKQRLMNCQSPVRSKKIYLSLKMQKANEQLMKEIHFTIEDVLQSFKVYLQ